MHWKEGQQRKQGRTPPCVMMEDGSIYGPQQRRRPTAVAASRRPPPSSSMTITKTKGRKRSRCGARPHRRTGLSPAASNLRRGLSRGTKFPGARVSRRPHVVGLGGREMHPPSLNTPPTHLTFCPENLTGHELGEPGLQN